MLTEAFEALERYAPNRPAIVVAETPTVGGRPQGGWCLDCAADGASCPTGAQHVGVVNAVGSRQHGCHQAVVVEGDLNVVGVLKWQHLLGAPCFWLASCSKNHLVKQNGFSRVVRPSDSDTLWDLVNGGEAPERLWRQGLFEEALKQRVE